MRLEWVKCGHECLCHCHKRDALGKVEHMTSCCTRCYICKKGIQDGLMETHVEQCHKVVEIEGAA